MAAVHALLRALAALEQWVPARSVLWNAWRGVGVDQACVAAFAGMLQGICARMADSDGSRATVHQLMDEVPDLLTFAVLLTLAAAYSRAQG